MSNKVTKTKVAAMNLASADGSAAIGTYSAFAAFGIATAGNLTGNMYAAVGTTALALIAFLGFKKYLDES
ncbi:hypothetical protein [Peredibacter starrii]|uniref:Uncharacterized protein n=1 Tax=Peredibacter starrii TaxID=28202 RepID=A0AAX4HNC2_9BACT|nr:hypothetical protein [Peredibacter starrii]WPU64822.1 hypothetical protein SOO65_19190 [Peredibacter starrii]